MGVYCMCMFFFFSSRRRHTRLVRDWSSDVCSSDLPWIDTDVDPQKLEMIVRLNDEEVQHGYTEEMLFSFAEIVSYISQQVTLRPGDLVFSGSTGVTVALKPGDKVDVEIPSIGVLKNTVKAEAA